MGLDETKGVDPDLSNAAFNNGNLGKEVNLNLSEYLVPSVPATAYYVPEFITPEQENLMLREIEKSPTPRWTQLSNRRLQNYGGVPHKNGMICEKIPDWLQKSAVDKVNRLSVFGEKCANHVLLNEYKAGEGIMPHLDGDLFYPTITTISIGSHTVLNFYEPEPDTTSTLRSWEDRKVFSLFVEPRSLLVLQDDMYHKYLHGIQEQTADYITNQYPNLRTQSPLGETEERGTRYSLTIRHVPKSTKFKLRLGR